jgi:hypothetical protein
MGGIQFRLRASRRQSAGVEGSPKTPGPLPGQMPDAQGDRQDPQAGKNPGVSPAMENETPEERKGTHDDHKEAADVVHTVNPALEGPSSMLKRETAD